MHYIIIKFSSYNINERNTTITQYILLYRKTSGHERIHE